MVRCWLEQTVIPLSAESFSRQELKGGWTVGHARASGCKKLARVWSSLLG